MAGKKGKSGRPITPTGVPAHRTRAGFGTGPGCPTCQSSKALTLDSRPTAGTIRRRRVCDQGHRYTTYETVPSGESPGMKALDLQVREYQELMKATLQAQQSGPPEELMRLLRKANRAGAQARALLEAELGRLNILR